MADPRLAVDHVSKRFGATQALADVSFALTGGEIHALVGENGAGKSTLIKILGGAHQPDTGTLRLDGAPRRLADPRAALAAGIVVIPQELRLVPALSVAENIMLGHLPTRRLSVDRRAMTAQARRTLDTLGVRVALDQRVDRLSFAERQLVAIGRALSQRARVLILDEPTAALEAREVGALFEVLRGLKTSGVAIVYVSHRLAEVVEIADRCTVLRDGRIVYAGTRGAFDTDSLIQHMTGRALETVRGGAGSAAAALFERADGFAVHEGEIVGLAGLLGSGTSRFLRQLFGAEPSRETVRMRGQKIRLGSPRDGTAVGIGLVPGDRALGLVLGRSVRDNIALPNLGALARAWRVDDRAIDRVVVELMTALDIRPRDPGRPVRELSGGNQQKVVFAKWLAAKVGVLLLDEPTQGVDIAAKAALHRLIRDFARRGGGVALTTADFDELLSLSDRVVALRDGAIVAQLGQRDALSEAALRRVLGG
ncbi:MAG: sugar ABC transporter ATP-binding protein [Proteobacteria bacterium]|nr:sugar ABC transporter ATP-binding protein [Pseudomonadota bacterium]